MKWHLALDLGTNSTGWAVYKDTGQGKSRLDGFNLEDLGVRIFSDGREPAKGGRVGDSLAVERRIARGMRRNRDRGKNRVSHTLSLLCEAGLMPSDPKARKDLEKLNPYALRAEALERALTPYELGRAIFHLSLRRGFKSNRKEAGRDDDGLRKQQITALRMALDGNTLGTFLNERLLAGQSVRFRGDTEYFPDRAMYEEEFEAIRQKQAPNHTLTDADWVRLRDECVLFQHPLKPVERGKCALLPQYPRAHRDAPIAQWFRIYQELNNLRWIDSNLISHRLTSEMRDAIAERLLSQKSGMKFSAMLKLKGDDGARLFPADARFNLEDERRKRLESHKIAIWMKNDPVLAPLWEKHGDLDLDDIFETLHEAQDDSELVRKLVGEFDLTGKQAEAFAALPISSITQNLSREIMERLVPIMREQGLTYDKAVAELTDENGNPLHHSQTFRPEQYDRLPYYGEVLSASCLGGQTDRDAISNPEGHFGRFPNPTVHIALNQLRKLVNRLIDRLGCPPQSITVELSRDLKLPAIKRNEINKEIAANEKRNKDLRKFWSELTGGLEATARDLKKLKLWEELGSDELTRRCVFTGRTIAAHHLLNGEVEIEHILPFSRTLDDRLSNLTLAFKDANFAKGNDTPYEAFALKSKSGFDWESILGRASRLPKNKSWRFTSEAMDRFEVESDFIARQMTDNAHIARSARKYLTCICSDVSPAPGRLTALVRGKWHLNLGDHNRKARDDHRHHAIDAFVIGLCDRSLLKQISTASGRGTDARLHIGVPDLPERLRQTLQSKLDKLVVSYKPDHGYQGKLFNETAYGILKEKADGYNLVVRKPINTLSRNEIEDIRDSHWQQCISRFLTENGWQTLSKSEQEKKLPILMSEFGEANNVRKLRILVKNQSAAPIPSAPHKAYAPSSFVCCDIWAIPGNGKGNNPQKTKFEGRFWAYTDCTADGVPDAIHRRPHPAARHLMRLFKDDMVAIFKGNRPEIMCVAGFSTTNNKLDLRPQWESDSKQKFFSINTLGNQGLHQIHVTPDGRVFGLKRVPT